MVIGEIASCTSSLFLMSLNYEYGSKRYYFYIGKTEKCSIDLPSEAVML